MKGRLSTLCLCREPTVAKAGTWQVRERGRQGWVHARVACCRMLSTSLNCGVAAKLHAGECEVSARSRLENLT